MSVIISMALVTLTGAIYMIKKRAYKQNDIEGTLLAFCGMCISAFNAGQQFWHNEAITGKALILKNIAWILWLVSSLLYGFIIIKGIWSESDEAKGHVQTGNMIDIPNNADNLTKAIVDVLFDFLGDDIRNYCSENKVYIKSISLSAPTFFIIFAKDLENGKHIEMLQGFNSEPYPCDSEKSAAFLKDARNVFG
jgi:hypothetical protein